MRAFFQRIKARRGFPTAVVATARKMTVLAWHLATKDQDYAFARPSLVAHKRRKLELAAGAPSRRGNHGVPRAAYNDRQRRSEERQIAEQAERSYPVFVAHWQPAKPKAPSLSLTLRDPPAADHAPVLGAVKIVRPVGRCILTAPPRRPKTPATKESRRTSTSYRHRLRNSSSGLEITSVEPALAPVSNQPSSTWSRSTRRLPPLESAAVERWVCPRIGSTSTAELSPSVTRWECPGRGSSCIWRTPSRQEAAARALLPCAAVAAKVRR
jgi:hypothetical protein